MKKFFALMMALALLCTSMTAFADQTGCQHNPETDEEIVVEPTCTEAGYTALKCGNATCGVEYNRVDYDALGHDFSVVVETKEATEEEEGYVVRKCSRCEETDTEVLEKLPASQPTPPAYEPKFTPERPELYGELVEINDPVHTHGYELKGSHKEPTCTEKGETTYFCADCGDSFIVYVKEKGHQIVEGTTTSITVKDPTCTEMGVTQYTGCGLCGSASNPTVWTVTNIAKLGHTYEGETKPDKVIDATCTEPKKEIYVCDRCGDEHTVEVGTKLGHTWERKGYEETHDHAIEPATCTTPGKEGQAIVCSDCGAIQPGSLTGVEVVPVLNHQKWLEDHSDYYYTVVKNEDGEVIEVNVDPSVDPGVNEIDPSEEIKALDKPTHGGQYYIVTGIYGALEIVYTPETCLETGLITVTCKECDAHIEQVIPASGHDWVIEGDSEGNSIKDCTKPNAILLKCKNCGLEKNSQIEAKPAHTIVDEDGNVIGDVVGYAQKKYTDRSIVKYYEKDYNDAFGHIATCADYYKIVKCRVCEQEELVLVKGSGKHNSKGATNYIYKKETCTTDGYELFECADCKYPQVIPHAATGHHMINGKTLKAPTCTESGLRETVCDQCAVTDAKTGKVTYVYSETEEIPAIGHHYVTTTIQPDCRNGLMGQTYKVCSLCGDKVIIKTWSGHTPKDGKYTTKTDATCTKDGIQSFVCGICHEYVTETIPALGHTFDVDTEDLKFVHEKLCGDGTEDDCEAATCKGGASHGTIHKIKCDRCNEVLTWEVDNEPADHTMYNTEGKLNNFVITKLPTCESTGLATYKCSLCGDIVEDYVLPALPHNLTPKFNAKRGAYDIVCTPIEIHTDNTEKLQKMLYSRYEKQVADAIWSRLIGASSQYVAGIGCNYVDEVVIEKTEYAVSQISELRGQIELKDEDTMAPLRDAYVRITWRYTLANGDTVGFTTCREVRADGTFKLTGLSAPEGSHCDFIYVEVVSDPDADELSVGEYNTYGTKSL